MRKVGSCGREEGLEARDDRRVGCSPREPHHPPPTRLQRRIPPTIGFESRAGAVTLPAVGLHDEAVRRPAEVDLEAWVVGGSEEEVRLRLRHGCGADEGQEPDLPLAPGELGLASGRLGQGSSPSVPVGAGQELGDRRVVVELLTLRLRERTLEAVRPDGRGEIEEGACDRRDRYALARVGVTGNEGTRAVEADRGVAGSCTRDGHVDARRVGVEEAPEGRPHCDG